MILGLTGSIGSGKSTVSKILKNLGLKIFDADLIAKEILNSNDVKTEIKKNFGIDFITEDNLVNKVLLKTEVFNNPKILEILNNIIHPKVISEYSTLHDIYVTKKEIVVFDVPLLFESGINKFCDIILSIDIDRELQIERVQKRDGISKKLLLKIISTQMPREERNKKSDIVIENNETLEILTNKITDVIHNIRNKRGIK